MWGSLLAVCAAGGHVDTHGSGSHAPVPLRDSARSGHDSCWPRARPHYGLFLGGFPTPFVEEAGEPVAAVWLCYTHRARCPIVSSACVRLRFTMTQQKKSSSLRLFPPLLWPPVTSFFPPLLSHLQFWHVYM